MIKDLMSLLTVLTVAGLVVYLSLAEERRRRQLLDLMRQLAERGQELPPELLESLLKQGSGQGPLRFARTRWLVSITLASIALGFLFWAFVVEDAVDDQKVMVTIALVFGAGAAGTALLARAEQRSGR
ncbi:MAG TPA: hypothetical protein VGB54_03240 [Allosphingosinicella sp.]|jgi:predicted anti-sigma-YlaC factor YlaD